MRHLIIYFAFLCMAVLSHNAYSQNSTISGYVKDSSNGEMLIGVNVFVKGTNTGTVTNTYGFYSISLPQGNYDLVFSYIGFKPIEMPIELTKDITIKTELKAEDAVIEEVVVKGDKKNENIRSTKMSNITITGKTVEKLPVMFGEVDIIKVMNLLPGIKLSSEASSSFSVRGGNIDQNLILLDEATVYNASHLGGIFSVFNNDAIKSADIFKGNIPVQFGGRLSSLVDIRMKDGDIKKFAGRGSIGVMSSKLTLEIPILKDKSSLLLSGRRSYLDLFTKMLHKINDTIPEIPLSFYDLNMKGNYIINDKHRIYLSGYFGRDNFNLGNSDFSSKFGWGNYTSTLRWNWMINQKLFSNITLLLSNYDYEINQSTTFGKGKDKKDYSFIWKADLKDYSVKWDLGYYLNPSNTIKFGVQTIYHDFNVGKVNGKFDTLTYSFKIPKTYSLEHAAYLGNEQKIGNKLTLTYGVRFSALQNLGKATVYQFNDAYETMDTLEYSSNKIYNTYSGFEPRFGFSYLISENNSVKGSYSKTRQYLHMASNSTSGLPMDVWLPSSPTIKPQIADLYSIGYFTNIFDNKIKASFEVYYKEMQNQIDFKEFAQPYMNPKIEGELRFGKGRSYGLEVLIEKPEGKFTGWISYTFAKSERKISGIQEKNWYLSPYDVPHELAIVGSCDITPRFSVSGNWTYRSGRPFNSPSARWETGNLTLPYYLTRNNDRLPNYHRLDLSIEYKFKDAPGSKIQKSLTLSGYNVYWRKNPSIIYFKAVDNNPDITKAFRTSLFPNPIVTAAFNLKF